MAAVLTMVSQIDIPGIAGLIYDRQPPLDRENLKHTTPLGTYSFQYHLKRGILRYYLGEYDKAISDFGTALRLNWRHEKAASWINKARACQQACS
jgi:tetratricopeptide (TPR) repeat protein